VTVKPNEKPVRTRPVQARSRKLDSEEAILSAILRLERALATSIRDLTDLVLEEFLKLTSSAIGFLALVSDDGAALTIPSWSRPSGREKLFVSGRCPYLPPGRSRPIRSALLAAQMDIRRPRILSPRRKPGSSPDINLDCGFRRNDHFS